MKKGIIITLALVTFFVAVLSFDIPAIAALGIAQALGTFLRKWDGASAACLIVSLLGMYSSLFGWIGVVLAALDLFMAQRKR